MGLFYDYKPVAVIDPKTNTATVEHRVQMRVWVVLAFIWIPTFAGIGYFSYLLARGVGWL